MAARAELTGSEAAFVRRQRVARLATTDPTGIPHVVPICYAYDGERFYTPLDEKPKKVEDHDLQRVRNIQSSDRVALVVDRYDDDWSRLAYVLIRGRAELMSAGTERHAGVLEILRQRYPQYAAMALETRPVIQITPQRVTSWGNLDAEEG